MECSCGEADGVLICEECDAAFCMTCYCHYEVLATSRLCWMCQNEADQEWLATNFRAARRQGPRTKTEEGC